jgi:HAMP domain-containing protein
MIVTLSTFADQVTGVARDVGVEGKLGGQADVPGAAGIWRDLTNNVNELAGNLTRQVRAIGDVATAVTKGDLTQSIDVEARGEVAMLKDNINQMIRTLAETTRVNQEQDWLKTNLARFTRMLQGQRDLLTVARQVLSELAEWSTPSTARSTWRSARTSETRAQAVRLVRLQERKHLANRFELGEGMVGQAALEKQAHPGHRACRRTTCASARRSARRRRSTSWSCRSSSRGGQGGDRAGLVPALQRHPARLLDQLLESLGIVVATIEATMRTDELLRQSQSMAEELQTQQEELQQTNEELEEKARQLTTQKDEVERKNREVELAKQELEEKAEQLALTSKYKSSSSPTCRTSCARRSTAC